MKIKPLCFLLVFLSVGQTHPFTECIDGMADFYECKDTDLLQRIHLEDIGTGSGSGNDIWGWTDPKNGNEYALMGLSTGTAFVDVTVATAPVYLGFLPTATDNSSWRDIKTFGNYAYIVSEAAGHGMQIFDLTLLRNVVNPPVNFSATANYTEFGNAHNIVINEDTGFAYAVGANCSGGLHMIDLSNPIAPVNSGCFSADNYTHDAQCVVYIGPDTDYVGAEICFNSNEDTLTIVNVTDKNSPVQISRTPYDDSRYTHQGWLTEDQRYYLMNDELDEQSFGHNTKTYIWDLVDLDSPQIIGTYIGPQPSIDHNLYIKGNYAFLSNYTSGLSVVDITEIGNGVLNEVASFDTFPGNNDNVFNGAWSNYPFFESGNVIVSDISGGLFILDPLLCPLTVPATDLQTQASGDNSISLSWVDSLEPGESYNIYRSDGGCDADNFVKIAEQITTETYIDSGASGLVDVGYKVSKINAEGLCESQRSTCSETQTTGICTAAPMFTGVSDVTSINNNTCGLSVNWNKATSYCGSDVTYNIYKSTDEAFEPTIANLVASGVSGQEWTDYDVTYEQKYHYLVKSVDAVNGQEDNNLLKMASIPLGVLNNGDWSAGAETGDTGIGQSTRHLGWELISDLAFSGDRSYWSQDENNACNQLTSDSFQLTANETSELSFYTQYDIESRWDGGVVEVSVDDGPWIMPPLLPDYPDTFRSSSDQCGYNENTPSFTGLSNSWTQHTMDLSAYQGQDIRVRFSYSTDGFVNNAGWYLDDIVITNIQTPGVCETVTDIIFIDGFD